MANCAPCHRLQTVGDHLHTAIVQRVELSKVQIADEDTGGSASSSLHTWAAAYSNGKPLFSHPGAHCSMMAKLVKSVATSAVSQGEREG